MTFERFVNQKREHYRAIRQGRRPRGQNNKLKRATGKLTLSTFDGSGRLTMQLDTCLGLKPMTEI